MCWSVTQFNPSSSLKPAVNSGYNFPYCASLLRLAGKEAEIPPRTHTVQQDYHFLISVRVRLKQQDARSRLELSPGSNRLRSCACRHLEKSTNFPLRPLCRQVTGLLIGNLSKVRPCLVGSTSSHCEKHSRSCNDCTLTVMTDTSAKSSSAREPTPPSSEADSGSSAIRRPKTTVKATGGFLKWLASRQVATADTPAESEPSYKEENSPANARKLAEELTAVSDAEEETAARTHPPAGTLDEFAKVPFPPTTILPSALEDITAFKLSLRTTPTNMSGNVNAPAAGTAGPNMDLDPVERRTPTPAREASPAHGPEQQSEGQEAHAQAQVPDDPIGTPSFCDAFDRPPVGEVQRLAGRTDILELKSPGEYYTLFKEQSALLQAVHRNMPPNMYRFTRSELDRVGRDCGYWFDETKEYRKYAERAQDLADGLMSAREVSGQKAYWYEDLPGKDLPWEPLSGPEGLVRSGKEFSKWGSTFPKLYKGDSRCPPAAWLASNYSLGTWGASAVMKAACLTRVAMKRKAMRQPASPFTFTWLVIFNHALGYTFKTPSAFSGKATVRVMAWACEEYPQIREYCINPAHFLAEHGPYEPLPGDEGRPQIAAQQAGSVRNMRNRAPVSFPRRNDQASANTGWGSANRRVERDEPAPSITTVHLLLKRPAPSPRKTAVNLRTMTSLPDSRRSSWTLRASRFSSPSLRTSPRRSRVCKPLRRSTTRSRII